MDEQTFSQRAMAMADKLHRLSYLILRNEADCEDAVQEALIRAWMGHSRLRDEALFETWLTRIVINESKRLLKRRAQRSALTTLEELPEATTPPPCLDPELQEALFAINPRERVPILLYHMEGYKAREIAALLHLPLTTVKWRLQKGRQLLKEALTKGAGK